MGVLLRRSALDQVAGKDNEVGTGIEAVERRHRPREGGGGVNDAHEKGSRRRNVSVGDLGYQHQDLRIILAKDTF
jgi:hypothetical protein